ncbi:hypothetical protein AOY38_15905 [Synechocystis sp. PCC 6803]|nr:hypothetical protein AOY38_15905 [Synechocystis sp. PCC 6803]
MWMDKLHFTSQTFLRNTPMSKVEKSVQRQETKSQSSAPKYRELSDAELEVVCGGSMLFNAFIKN